MANIEKLLKKKSRKTKKIEETRILFEELPEIFLEPHGSPPCMKRFKGASLISFVEEEPLCSPICEKYKESSKISSSKGHVARVP